MKLYVARKKFRQSGVFYNRGDVIEHPESIRHLKAYIHFRKIVMLDKNDKNYKSQVEYLEQVSQRKLKSTYDKYFEPKKKPTIKNEVSTSKAKPSKKKEGE